MTYQNYEFTAFREADLLSSGDHNLNRGDSFEMPSSSTVDIRVIDNDHKLSGDNYRNDRANDQSGQKAFIDGVATGGHRKIYVEQTFTVKGSNGETYTLAEIEIGGHNAAGAGDDYFTFVGDVPPAGVTLTVVDCKNVKGHGIEYEKFSADAAPAPSPWVLDDDCVYTIEAEDMHLDGFHTVHGNHASGGELVKLSGHDGKLSTDFGGESGTYNLIICVQDECDGNSMLKIRINGELVETIILNENNNGRGSDNGGFSEVSIPGLSIEAGDTVEISAWRDGGEFVRIDALKFEQEKPVEPVVCDDPNAVLIDFEGFSAGTVISDQYDGITIDAQRFTHNTAANDAMVFDSNNPTGGDSDLATANQGNILIISEDNDSSDPDDAIGGDITFSFDNPSRVFNIAVIDTEEGGTITLTLDDGSVQTVDIPRIGDGEQASVMIDVENVVEMNVRLNGSGAIDDLCYVPGEAQLGSLSGRYFFDANRDGLDNDGANAIAGVLVELLDENGVPTGASVTTDADGNYSFTDLMAGTYGVKFTDAVDGRELTTQNVDGDVSDAIDSDAADIGGGMSTITNIVVVAGADTPDNDAGVVEELGSLSGRYFCDDDDDGTENNVNTGQDVGVEGFTVVLLDATGAPVLDADGNQVTTTTAADGSYSFTGLVPGDYGVQFVGTPPTKDFIDPNQGNNDAVDSDAIDNGDDTATISSITVTAGNDTPDNDVGVVDVPGSLSGRYFFDADRNGQDDDANNAIAGIEVELLDENGAPTGVTTTTDADGNYSFGNLAPGTYGVKFTDPDTGRELTSQNVGNDATDSDAGDVGGGMSTITGITVNAGEDTPDNDAGVVDLLGSLSGRYFCDDDRDGLDNDGSDNGVTGVTVELLDAAGNPTGRTTSTDANGNYVFTGLVAGTYGVLFTDAVSGKTLTTQNVDGDDSDDIDSDATDLGGGVSSITGIAVTAGNDTPDNDAGVFPNDDPIADDASAMGCADEEIVVDFSGSFSDSDSASVNITMINGQAITAGQTIDVDGVLVTLTDSDEFIFDGEAAFADLNINEQDTKVFEVKVEDSDGGTATAEIDVTFKGDANDYASLADTFPATAEYVVSGALDNPDAFTLEISNSGDARFDGASFTNAYCLSFFEPIPLDTTVTGNVVDVEGVSAPAVFDPSQVSSFNGMTAADNLDLVSWIVAQDFEGQGIFDGWDVQFAIWELTDNIDTDDWTGTFTEATPSDVDAILALAASNEGFEFGADGSNVGAIIDPNPQTPGVIEQPFIIGFAFDDVDCIC